MSATLWPENLPGYALQILPVALRSLPGALKSLPGVVEIAAWSAGRSLEQHTWRHIIGHQVDFSWHNLICFQQTRNLSRTHIHCPRKFLPPLGKMLL